MIIKKGGYEQNFSLKEKNALELGSGFLYGQDYKIMTETEKAINVMFSTDYGKFGKGIPKSVGGDE